MSTPTRRIEVERLRKEGRAARLDGRHRQTVPRAYVGNMNRIRWEEGWDAADRELSATWSELIGISDLEFAR